MSPYETTEKRSASSSFCIYSQADKPILTLDSEAGRMCLSRGFDLVCKMMGETMCQGGGLYENIG